MKLSMMGMRDILDMGVGGGLELGLVLMVVVGQGKRSVYRVEGRWAIWWWGLGVGEIEGEVVDRM
jgi:hypothetical protein